MWKGQSSEPGQCSDPGSVAHQPRDTKHVPSPSGSQIFPVNEADSLRDNTRQRFFTLFCEIMVLPLGETVFLVFLILQHSGMRCDGVCSFLPETSAKIKQMKLWPGLQFCVASKMVAGQTQKLLHTQVNHFNFFRSKKSLKSCIRCSPWKW